MSAKAEILKCPGCGWPVSVGDTECPAGHPLYITTFNSVRNMEFPLLNKYTSSYTKHIEANPGDSDVSYSLGLCFLKLKIYDKALAAFEKSFEEDFDNHEAYFYAAVCLLQGKIPFAHNRETVDKIINYLNAAVSICPQGVYYYFLAYVRHDYFKRKFLRVLPTYDVELRNAVSCGITQNDIAEFYDLLGTNRPAGL